MSIQPKEEDKYYKNIAITEAKDDDGKVKPGEYDISTTSMVKKGKALNDIFAKEESKDENILLFIEVDGARFYAPLKNIFYYDGIDEITLSKTTLKLDEILKRGLFYQDANGKHKITALDETNSYKVDVKKDPNCSLERVVGVDKGNPVVKTYSYTVKKVDLGKRLTTARESKTEAKVCEYFASKGVTTMNQTRLKEIEAGKAKEPLTAAEEKVFIECYGLKNDFFNEFMTFEEKSNAERKLDAKVVTQKVVENPDMTINVRETTNGVATTVKAGDVYLLDKDGNRETESLAKVLEEKRAGSLVGKKAQLKVGDKFVDLQPLSRADVNTINNVGKVLQISEYSYSETGKYIKVTLATSKQEQLVEIEKLWDGDKQIETAKDLELYVGKTLVYKEKREDAGVAIAPLTAEQALMTYVGAEPHMEEVADEYVETEETRYLLTQDGNFVDEKAVSPISYDKGDNETTCDAFLVTNKEGEQFVVTKKDMDSLTVPRSDLYKDIEPLKLSIYDLEHAYVIQTSNSALDGIEHKCSVVGKIEKKEDRDRAVTEAEAQFLALYKHNLYDVDFVVQRQYKAPHCYKKIGKAVNADAIMVVKGTETFIISKEKYDSMSHATRNKYSKIVPLELLPDGDLEHADVIQTSRKRGEEFHSCVDVSMHSATKGTKRVKAVNSAVEAFTKALSEGNYNFDVEIVELDPRHKRYAERTESTVKRVSLGDQQYIKGGMVTVKDGKIAGGPRFDANEKANKFVEDTSQIALGLAGLCISPIGFLLSPVILGAATITFLTGLVGAGAIGLRHLVKTAKYDRTKVERNELKNKNTNEVKMLLEKARNAKTEKEKEQIIQAINSSFDSMLKDSQLMYAKQNGEEFKLVDGKCKVDVNNALAFRQYKKEHKALAKEVKKLAKSKKAEDVAKREELEAKLKSMETNYTASTMSPADPRADEYNQYLQNQQKFLLYVAGLDPNSEEAKIAKKCKLDDKKMAITYKGVDINAEIDAKTKPEVKNVVETIKAAVAEKEPHKPEIVATDVIKNEVFTPKISEEANKLEVDAKTGTVAKKEVVTEDTTEVATEEGTTTGI